MASYDCYSTNYSGTGLTYSSGTYTIMAVLFISCRSSTAGGGVFADSSSFNGEMKYCTFSYCYSGDRGGGFCIFNGSSFNVSRICYNYNQAADASNGNFWSDYHYMMAASYNYTSECLTNSSYHGTTLGGRNSFYATDNNVTGTITTGYGAGILLLIVPSQLVVTRLNSINGYGPGTWTFESHASPTISSSNTINNTITSSYLIRMNINTAVTMVNCVFIGNTVVSTIYGPSAYTSTMGMLSLTKCSFDSSYSAVGFSYVTSSSISFGAQSSDLNSVLSVDEKICNYCPSDKFTTIHCMHIPSAALIQLISLGFFDFE